MCPLSLRTFPQRLCDLRQFVENRTAAQPQFVIDRGIAADHRSGGNIAGNTGLGSGNSAVANLAMPGNANLPGENHVVAVFGRSRQSYLGTKQGIVSDTRSVSYLNQIVDLCAAADTRVADSGDINAC